MLLITSASIFETPVRWKALMNEGITYQQVSVYSKIHRTAIIYHDTSNGTNIPTKQHATETSRDGKNPDSPSVDLLGITVKGVSTNSRHCVVKEEPTFSWRHF